MAPITSAIVAAGTALFGGLGAASVAGSPRAKDRAFDRAQARRQCEIDALEAQLRESQLAGAGYRAAPPDTRALDAQLEAARRAKMAAFRAYYFGDGGR